MLLSFSSVDSAIQLLSLLVLFAAVLFITYITLRWAAGYQKTVSGGRLIQVIETTQVSSGKYIQVIRTGYKIIVIGLSKDSVDYLCELDAEKLETDGILTFDENGGVSLNRGVSSATFKELFENLLNKKNSSSTATDDENDKENL